MAYLGTKPANQVIDSTLIADGTVTPADLSTGKPVWDTSGNVGIGTSSPNVKLQVIGSSTVTDPVIRATNSGATQSMALTSGGLRMDGGAPIQIYQGGSEVMRIDSSGNLLLGSTSKYSAGLPGAVIQVNAANSGGFVLGNGTSNIAMYRDTVNNITYWFNGSNQAALTAAGAWTNASDAKLKKDITTIKYGLNTVLATEPRSYKRVDCEGEYVGFVAQEIKEHIPEVVFGSDTVQYSVDYGSLVAVAFKAIQELKEELDTVKAELATLKGTA